MTELNFLDRIIGFFSPRTAHARATARLKMQAIEDLSGKSYDGAGRGRRTSGWFTRHTSAITEIALALPTLRDRSRDLIRNNAYAARAKSAMVSNVVGTGIIATVEADNQALADDVLKTWQAWAETQKIDTEFRQNIFNLQSLAMGAAFESGEFLIRRRRRRASDNLPVPLQLQFIESDFLDSSKNFLLDNGGMINQGIEYDKLGRRVNYWLFAEHPGGNLWHQAITRVSQPVPSEDVIHTFKMDRPGQIRGVPTLAPVMIPLKDLDDYQDARLVSQKVAACFAVFVTEPEIPMTPSKTPDPRERVEPGMVEVLPPGRDIKVAAPQSPTDSDYVRQQLQRVGAGIGLPYEILAGDLSQVNFSSGRMGWLEFNRLIEVWRWQVLIPQMLDQIFAWFLEAYALKTGRDVSSVKVRWTPPRREMIDPVAEVNATTAAIRSGLKSFSEAVRELGNDPKTHFGEYAADLKLLDSFGLSLDSDPRKTTKAGIEQIQAPQGGSKQ